MSIITLHLRIPRDAPLCAACGAALKRPAVSWWMKNTWTDSTEHFTASSTHTPGETAIPCGRLPGAATTEAPKL